MSTIQTSEDWKDELKKKIFNDFSIGADSEFLKHIQESGVLPFTEIPIIKNELVSVRDSLLHKIRNYEKFSSTVDFWEWLVESIYSTSFKPKRKEDIHGKFNFLNIRLIYIEYIQWLKETNDPVYSEIEEIVDETKIAKIRKEYIQEQRNVFTEIKKKEQEDKELQRRIEEIRKSFTNPFPYTH